MTEIKEKIYKITDKFLDSAYNVWNKYHRASRNFLTQDRTVKNWHIAVCLFCIIVLITIIIN